MHLDRWGIIPSVVTAGDVVPCYLFGVVVDAPELDVMHFPLQGFPISVDLPIFERVMTAIAYK